MSRPCAAFLSYVRFDDQHENGRLTQLRERLSGEVRLQTGGPFEIFQDRSEIAWGEQWRQRIEESLDAVTFLIPILSPGFFRSEACRGELERFLERERKLRRNDLILPVLYVHTPVLAEEARRKADPLAEALAARQYLDWRELRFEPWTSPSVGRVVARMAEQIVAALDRGPQPLPPKAAPQGLSPKGVLDPDSEAGAPSEVGAGPSARPSSRYAAKTEPPTLIVDAFHRGDFATLTEAVKAAKPGSRILVRPGIYKEGVILDKPLEILGDGEPGDVVIEAAGCNVILFRTTMGRIANLTLRQAGGGQWYGLDIAQGRLEVEDCDVTSQSFACVAIHGGAEPRLRRNRIHDGKSAAAGVVVYENGQGILEDNEIFGNAYAGVEIKGGGNPILRRNRIHDGKSSGVHVLVNGQGILEDNEIFGNALAGVAIAGGGNPTLLRNRIHDGKKSGVHVYENGQGIMEDNEIFGNALAGVEIKGGGNPTLRRNRIHDGKSAGVYVYDNGQGTLEDNEIHGNASAGVVTASGGSPTVLRNQIRSNATVAVSVASGGEGVFEDNDLRGNSGGAWEIHPGGETKIRRARNQE